MRSFSERIGNATYLVVDYRRGFRYVNGKKTEILDSRYIILHNYDQITITVADDGSVVSQEDVKVAADAGVPIEMEFFDLEITIRPKNEWEIKASGRASKAALVKSK